MFNLCRIGDPATAEPAEHKPRITVDKAERGRGVPNVHLVSVKDGANIDGVLSNAKIKETTVKSAVLNLPRVRAHSLYCVPAGECPRRAAA
ncbi:hypothetical protein JK358_10725 [Nocardia sp. 2]|uniref:Uncharacterized protein n=1 Tax=Nocardia acididurans TaxID=2802282 RepID=A0ABS1M2W4_9NOCA|nr:hypothetical protein [Nocardia acididurans]MBL1074866.1 hypothetical protein [Nocardia acididurans]